MNQEPIITKNNALYLRLIAVVSVLIPVVVAVLFYSEAAFRIEGFDARILPHINAVLNSATFVMLLSGYFFIKSGNIAMHRLSMFTAFVLSSLFLVSYVIYHNNVPSTPFGGTGIIRVVYLSILLTHILLAVVVVPLVLLAIYFAVSGQIAAHKRIVKWTFPIWTYVAASGVIVYLMISPYYQ